MSCATKPTPTGQATEGNDEGYDEDYDEDYDEGYDEDPVGADATPGRRGIAA